MNFINGLTTTISGTIKVRHRKYFAIYYTCTLPAGDLMQLNASAMGRVDLY